MSRAQHEPIPMNVIERLPENLPAARSASATLLMPRLQTMMLAFPEGGAAAKTRFAQIAIAVANESKLAECTPVSVVQSIYGCAKLGLVPDPVLGHIHIVPFRQGKEKIATLIVGYKGFIELARRSGHLRDIAVEVVYDNDFFKVRLGTDRRIEHEPWFQREDQHFDAPGGLRAVYCVWKNRDGSTGFHWMLKGDVLARRDSSSGYRYAKSSGGDSPWITDEASMWRKSVLRDAAKLWPQSPALAEAVMWDEQGERGELQQVPNLNVSVNMNNGQPHPGDDIKDDPMAKAVSEGGMTAEEMEAIRRKEIEESGS